MSSLSFLFIFAFVIVLLFLAINFILAPHLPYQEKLGPFECGFKSFQQTRSQFHLPFFIYGILYLIFDLEIILLYPYALSAYENGIYGLVIMLLFTLIITFGFIYELCSGALTIDSRQNNTVRKSNTSFLIDKIGIRRYSSGAVPVVPIVPVKIYINAGCAAAQLIN